MATTLTPRDEPKQAEYAGGICFSLSSSNLVQISLTCIFVAFRR